jgi:hypothetical protein
LVRIVVCASKCFPPTVHTHLLNMSGDRAYLLQNPNKTFQTTIP